MTNGWTRRDVLGAAIGAAAAAVVAGDAEARSKRGSGDGRMPALFLAHGAPPLLDDAAWMTELAGWAASIRRPRAILMLSAHWEARPATLGATRTVPLLYDFYGFPARYYAQQYPAPGAPELAQRIRAMLKGEHTVADDPDRGLDHGAYVPLVAMYPEADVPVLQMSLPSEDAKELFELGRALRPLRDEGVLIVGSGFLTHNLRTIDWRGGAPPQWAVEFDEWVAQAIAKRDVGALLDFMNKGPAARLALPTREHFVPLLVAAGAAADGERIQFPITGFWMGSFTRRSVQFG